MAEYSSEIDEDPTLVEKCIPEIQQWIPTIPDLYGRTDEEFVLPFLRNCKYDLEKTKQKILRYYTNRKKYPQWMQNRDPLDERMQGLLKLEMFAAMGENRDPNNSLVVIAQLRPFDLQLLGQDALVKLEFLMLEVFNRDKTNQISGMAFIADMKAFTVGLMAFFTPKVLYSYANCLVGGMPIKIKAIHLFNTHRFLYAVITLFKLFLPEKIRKRVHVHGGDLETLHKYFPANCLPLEFGGTAGPIQEYRDLMVKTIMERRDYIVDDDRYGMNAQQSEMEQSRSLDID